jgi:hypothetical protein
MMGVAEVVPAARGQAVAVASSGLDPITGLCHL